jgi:ABC-type molybdate transport system substrate-binding protein
MKKVFAILAVAGLMAACNSGADKDKAAADSVRVADSLKNAASADSAKAVKMTPDSLKADSAKPKM